ncbi:colicin E3/pyocin S6 family cytotoxin [Rhodococcus sp. ARC_M12]|uniref:colicin E3/pyocin S6 family cytotoxin n=1 Tax=Rhodococcus sp. ARC_M12 TaxID=2928854 RepID=UPI001FB1E914|nr:colicin E3/pyocin S6 family cytotoxin [Rhodococcus sp. ARC_M12]MCJ0980957.1 colicin E3/pyocin S6 family cytotoxin [Rhodococcus sp. ARC_M12]
MPLLPFTPRPRPSVVDDMEKLKTINGRSRWRDEDGFIYEYDGSHGGELEKYDKRGYHRGVVDVVTGEVIKKPVRGRRITDV